MKMATTTTTAETSAPAVTSEEPSEQPPSEDEIVLSKLAEGIFGILGPSVTEIDDRVKEVRKSQSDLQQQIDRLHEELKNIAEKKEVPQTLEAYIKKLANCRRRVHLVNELLRSIQERLSKLQQNVSRETQRRRAAIESTSYLTT